MKTLALLLLSVAMPVFGQNCDSAIIDPGNLLGSQSNAVLVAAHKLGELGVDPRVIVADPSYLTPEGYVSAMQGSCGSWQSASGGPKQNMIVFLVFPNHRKMDVEVAPEYAKAIHKDDLKANYMAPSFKDRDWAAGMIKAMNQAGIQIKAYQEAALHPAVVTQQATDLHGLWVVLGWIVVLLTGVGLIWLGFYLFSRRMAVKDAQQAAAQARNDAARRLQNMSAWLEAKEALKVDVAASRKRYDATAEDFAQVSQQETFNPATKGLSAGQYDTIAKRYQSISNNLVYDDPAPDHRHYRSTRNAREYASSAATAPTPTTTTVIHEHYSEPAVYAPVTVIDDSPMYVPETRYAEPVHESSHDSWSGGSSSFDSDSSSGSFDGGSSSFDSGGDSGGFDGGSSDF